MRDSGKPTLQGPTRGPLFLGTVPQLGLKINKLIQFFYENTLLNTAFGPQKKSS